MFSEQYKREPIDTNTLISGYLQYKGIKKNYSGEEVNKYLFKTLLFTEENTSTRLELKWMAEYQEYFGINFVIDRLSLPPTKQAYYYFITVCLCPPANYYKGKSFDLNLCRKVNFETSRTTEMYFLDNEFFVNPPYHKSTCLIIEVNRVEIFESETTQADSNIQGYAYLVVPLFELEEKIRSVDAKQVTTKLFEGDFDNNNIEKLEKNLKGFMQKNESSKKVEAEISFRVLNGYFMNQYPNVRPEPDSKAPFYRDLPPEGMSFDDALEEIASVLSNNYNLQVS